MGYTLSQQEAIKAIDQNLQIIACAGSGKTQVISQRIVEILKAGRVDGTRPEHIVAFTFTKKAAEELKARIDRLCLEELGSDQGLAEMYVGTIHGYCLQLLQQSPSYEYLKCRVLTDVQQLLMLYRSPKSTGVNQIPWPKPKKGNKSKDKAVEEVEAVERSNEWEKAKLYQKLVSILDESDIEAEKVPREVREAIGKYRAYLNKDHKKYLDFTGLLRLAVEEIEARPQLQQKIKDTVRYLIVDEYQDVSPMQERLIEKITELGANLCVVGDDDQTIYQWRGSDVRNILGFQKRYKNVKSVKLEENFRSSDRVVQLALSVAQGNKDRLPKQMKSMGTQSSEPGDLLALEFSDREQEAAWIASKIQSMLGTSYQKLASDSSNSERGLAWSDFVILVRAWSDTAPIAEALRKLEIPFVSGGENVLFDAPEAEAMRMAYCYLSASLRGSKFKTTSSELRQALLRGFPAIGNQQIDRGIEYLDEIRAKLAASREETRDQSLFLQQVYFDLIAALCLCEENVGNSERSAEAIFYNLGKFSQLITDYEQIGYKTQHARCYERFAEFLVNHASDFYDEESSETAQVSVNAVQITTIHQAKGMQWPVVFIPCLRKNHFPMQRRGSKVIFDLIQDFVPRPERYRGSVEDERRLFYVALTRAEKYLFCTWGPIVGNRNQQRASDFFTEVASSDLVLKQDRAIDKKKAMELPRSTEYALPLTFSELRYYLECPYSYKLRFIYGFNAPMRREMGLGKSIHDALCEVHGRALGGEIPKQTEARELAQKHLHLPFINLDIKADQEIKQNMLLTAEKIIERYLNTYSQRLEDLQHAEKIIELKLEDGTHISGRIDLIRKVESGELAIVEFKTSENTQPRDLTRFQLCLYVAGYQAVAGASVDLIETHHLQNGSVERESISQQTVEQTSKEVCRIAKNILNNDLPKQPSWHELCDSCDFTALCRVNR